MLKRFDDLDLVENAARACELDELFGQQATEPVRRSTNVR